MSYQRPKYEEFRRDAEGVLDYYQELTSTNCSNSCEAFYKMLGMGVGRNSGGSYSPCQPTSSDFVADVETTVRKSLSPSEYKLFRTIWMNPDLVAADKAANDHNTQATREHILRKLGQAFNERGIAPLNMYFKAKDLR